MTWQPDDPRRTPSKWDQLGHGVDCAVHPLLGNVVSQNGTPVGDQARNYLRSLRDATIHQVSGRAGDMSQEEFVEWMRKLEKWERSNSVRFPPPAKSSDRPTVAPPATPQPPPTAADKDAAFLRIMKMREQQVREAVAQSAITPTRH